MAKLKSLGILIFWLGVWQLCSMWIDIELLLVSPIDTALRLTKLVQENFFWLSIATSLERIMSGFLWALLVASVLAFWAAKVPLVHEFMAPLFNVIKSIPVASFIILALVWVKSGYLSTFCSFIMVLPIIYTSLHQGLVSVSKELLEVGEVYRLSRWSIIKKIYVPSIIPYLISSCSVGLGLAWKSGVAAEVIGLLNSTIGMQLYNAKVSLEMTDLFAWTLVIVLLSFLLEKVVLLLIKLLDRRFQIMHS